MKCVRSPGHTFFSTPPPQTHTSPETIKLLYIIVNLFFLISNQYPLPPSIYSESKEPRWTLVGSLYCEQSVSHQWAEYEHILRGRVGGGGGDGQREDLSCQSMTRLYRNIPAGPMWTAGDCMCECECADV